MEALVSTERLAGEIASGASDLCILDATLLDPASGRDARAEYDAGHIPGAVFMDLAGLADPSSGLPNMLPPTETFAGWMQALGIGDDSRIVVYDDSPWRTAARAWWMLGHFGARQVALLDGGLARWKAEGRALETGDPSLRHRPFTARPDRTSLRDKVEVAAALEHQGEQLVDARSAARFSGAEPEVRAGIASGHIPGSRSLPYTHLFRPDGTWKRGEALRAAFDDAGVDPARPLIATCGSGITAAVLVFGAHLLGRSDVSLYDGSWSEWGGDPATPKATGAA